MSLGDKDGLNLSKGEEKELALDLLREWWMTTFQALNDVAGDERSGKLLAPYSVNANIAMSRNLPQILGVHEISMETGALTLEIVNRLLLDTTCHTMRRGKREIRTESKGCCMKGYSWPFCQSGCGFGGKAFAETFWPDVDYQLTKSLGRGDTYCSWAWNDKSIPDDGDTKESGIESLTIPEDQENELSLHFLGEFWTITIRAYVDFAGSEGTINQLAPYMRHSGMSVGIQLKKQYKIGSDLESLIAIFKMIGKMHHIKGTIVESSNSLECEVNECPFSDGPMELCQQYGSFFNGLLEAINPDFEFVYDKMVTKGDTICHWTIRKKNGPDRNKQVGEKTKLGESALELLKMRLINEEITPEHYRLLRDLLLEK